MARKNKIAEDQTTEDQTTEDQDEQPVVLTETQQIIAEALADESGEALEALKNDEGTADKLKTLITVYTALLGALGIDAGATIAARANLEGFTPDKVKAPKEKVWSEVKALKDALASENIGESLEVLVNDERISEALKNAIITYTTLAGLPLDEAIITGALETLSNFGKKAGARSGTRTPSGPKEHFDVEVDGVAYPTLIAAIRAQGIGDEMVETRTGKQNKAEDVAWRTVRIPLLRDGKAEYDGKTYLKVAPKAKVEEPESDDQESSAEEPADETSDEA